MANPLQAQEVTMKLGASVLLIGLLFGGIALGQNVRKSIATLDPNGPEIASLRKGIQAMQSRAATDPTSWKFQASIHATYDQPSNQQEVQTWNQCQHGQFFFLSWHRMYLYYFERILRAASGDASLTLPYWNYSDPTQRGLPLPFRQPADPSANPLFVSERDANMNDGTGFLPAGAVDLSALNCTNFDTSDPQCPSPYGFGSAAVPQPEHFNELYGALEETPHNVVHVLVGGQNVSGQCNGSWMTDPLCSARDPIFFLHHANIDRLWKRWLDQGGGRQDPLADQAWMSTQFTFYDENAQPHQLTGKDILDTVGQLNYCYDDDPGCLGTGPPQPKNCSVMKLVCGNEATLVCDPIPLPDTLVLEARDKDAVPLPDYRGVGLTPPMLPDGANIVYDAPISQLDNEFKACAVDQSFRRNCIPDIPFFGPDLTGCPGGPPPHPLPTCAQCRKEGCACRAGGGCLCQ
jgi:hypothetical protein